MNTKLTPGPAPVPVDLVERDALLAGLAEVKRTGLTIKYGPRGGPKTVRLQLNMTTLEHQMLQTLRSTASLTVGRPVSSVLLMRVGLRALMKACAAALKDPVAAEKLKQDILRAREERLADGKVAV